MSLPTARYRPALDGMATVAGLPGWAYRGAVFAPGEWWEGLILQESSGNPKARRYEPAHDRAGRRDAPTDADTADHDDGDLEDDASYGLTQLMGENARVLCGVPPGGRMSFGFLFLPMINLALGLRLLLAEIQNARGEKVLAVEVERALCRYNGGPTGDDLVDGDFRLRAYVDRVARRAIEVRADRRANP